MGLGPGDPIERIGDGDPIERVGDEDEGCEEINITVGPILVWCPSSEFDPYSR